MSQADAGTRFRSRSQPSRLRSYSMISEASQDAPAGSRIVRHTAATPSSNSDIRTRVANCSKATVKLAMAPPANGSTKSRGFATRDRTHSRSRGTSHVFPPG